MFYDLVLKVCEPKDISYLEKRFNVSLNDMSDNISYMYVIDNPYILKVLNDVYQYVLDNGIEVDDELFNFLILSNERYSFLYKKMDEYRNLKGLKEFDDNDRPKFLDSSFDDYPFNLDAKEVMERMELFSLRELFSLENGEYSGFYRIGGVSLITPFQTVCMFNDSSNGYVGSGFHNDSFYKIIRAIYGRSFTDSLGLNLNDTGQDIRVSFSNNFIDISDTPKQRVMMLVDIPVPINSLQFTSLKILNEEIKKVQEEMGIYIEVSSCIINYYDDEFFLEYEGTNNLDDILKYVIVSDDYNFEYSDKYIIGFVNGDNHYNDSSYKLKKLVENKIY